MKKIAIISLFICIFVTFTQAQDANNPPQFPNFTYVSTAQVNEDAYGIDTNFNYIFIRASKDTLELISEQWHEVTEIQWELTYKRQNRNGTIVYQYEGRTSTGMYTIPLIFKNNKWMCGYLTERLCVGVDMTRYQNITLKSAKHINKAPSVKNPFPSGVLNDKK